MNLLTENRRLSSKINKLLQLNFKADYTLFKSSFMAKSQNMNCFNFFHFTVSLNTHNLYFVKFSHRIVYCKVLMAKMATFLIIFILANNTLLS